MIFNHMGCTLEYWTFTIQTRAILLTNCTEIPCTRFLSRVKFSRARFIWCKKRYGYTFRSLPGKVTGVRVSSINQILCICVGIAQLQMVRRIFGYRISSSIGNTEYKISNISTNTIETCSFVNELVGGATTNLK